MTVVKFDRRETEPAEAVRPVSRDNNVGVCQQLFEAVSIWFVTEVKERGALPLPCIQVLPTEFRHARAVDAQDICPEERETASGHRPGYDPGQVEHPNALQRRVTVSRPPSLEARVFALLYQANKGFRCQGLSLRMSSPTTRAANRADDRT
nr:hypothetical protein [Cryobacterium sp. Hh38]